MNSGSDSTDLVVVPTGVLAAAGETPARGQVDVEGLLQRTALWLKDFDNTNTAAAYARDLGVAYVVQQYDLQEHVDRLAPASLRAMLRARTPTRRAAAPDLLWYPACVGAGLDPFEDVVVEHVRLWISAMNDRKRPDDSSKHLLSQSARTRRLSVVSSLMDWGLEEGLLDFNPVHRVNRKRAGLVVNRHRSTTRGISARQLDLLVYSADHDPLENRLRTAAVVALICSTGVRVSEIVALDLDDYEFDGGYRTLDLLRKGGKRQRIRVPAPAAARIDAYLAYGRFRNAGTEVVLSNGRPLGVPGSAPLFATAAWRGKPGGGRWARAEIRELLQRVAKLHPELAPIASLIHPHTLRHSLATRLLDEGVPLQDVQDLLGHEDAATTRRYDRAREELHRSPAGKAGDLLERGLAALEREFAA
jgi:site-specific recombinase XerD